MNRREHVVGALDTNTNLEHIGHGSPLLARRCAAGARVGDEALEHHDPNPSVRLVGMGHEGLSEDEGTAGGRELVGRAGDARKGRSNVKWLAFPLSSVAVLFKILP